MCVQWNSCTYIHLEKHVKSSQVTGMRAINFLNNYDTEYEPDWFISLRQDFPKLNSVNSHNSKTSYQGIWMTRKTCLLQQREPVMNNYRCYRVWHHITVYNQQMHNKHTMEIQINRENTVHLEISNQRRKVSRSRSGRQPEEGGSQGQKWLPWQYHQGVQHFQGSW